MSVLHFKHSGYPAYSGKGNGSHGSNDDSPQTIFFHEVMPFSFIGLDPFMNELPMAKVPANEISDVASDYGSY